MILRIIEGFDYFGGPWTGANPTPHAQGIELLNLAAARRAVGDLIGARDAIAKARFAREWNGMVRYPK